MNKLIALCASGALLSFAACGDDTGSGGAGGGQTTASSTTSSTSTSTSSTTGSTTSSTTSSSTGAGGAAAFSLTSSAFGEGEMIPQQNVCTGGNGQNLSPALSWTAGPTGTLSYAIVMRDLDFQNGFLHWVIWDIPAATSSLPEGVEAAFMPSVPAGAKQAAFNGQIVGYFGPCSPNSVNTYEFTLHAVDSATLSGLDAQSTKAEAAAAIEAASLGSTSLAGES